MNILEGQKPLRIFTYMKDMDKIEQLRQRLLQMNEDEFDQVLNENNDRDKRTWSTIQRNLDRTDGLRYKPHLILKLAEGFTNAQQMVEYKGENEEQINAAGRYISYNKIEGFERPEWFDEIYRGETVEECIEILTSNCSTSKDIYADPNYVRLLNRCYMIIGPDELKKRTLGKIKWGRMIQDDDLFLEILSNYNNTREVRQKKIHKFLLTKMQVDKGDKFPKSYARYQEMMIDPSEVIRSKRGNYKQRTPAIEQYDLEGNLLQIFPTWNDVEGAGFKRSSVASAIRGTDGHNRHKGFIWKHS